MLAIALLPLAAACGREPEVPEQRAPETAAAHVDSILPPHEALRRFRTGLAEPAAGLGGGERSIDSLVARWAGAVASHDTGTIRRLLLNRPEFAWLYYPSSPFAGPPYYQPPDLVWFQFQVNGEKGIVRVLRRLGGSDLRLRGVTCAEAPKVQGDNRIWERCMVRREVEGDTVSQRLFGGIIERDGRFKFISYSNEM